MILAGDIGGTKTVLGLFRAHARGLEAAHIATYPSKQFSSLETIVTEFLASHRSDPPRAGCFGVAGAVIEGASHITNLGWQLSEHSLAAAADVPRVKLLNDLEATAFGMLHLAPDGVHTLNPGRKPPWHGNIAVIAAGTGLGESCLFWDGADYHPMASEGGHADFSPRNSREIALLNYLHSQHADHVSWERVLSGPGFLSIYYFLRDCGYHEEPAGLHAQLQQSAEPNAIITRLGLAKENDLCQATLEMFVDLYGAQAGNLALGCLALSGLYLAGGIAPKILPALRDGPFMNSFGAKGRFRQLLESIPVHVVLNAQAPLQGAAHYAQRLIDRDSKP